MAGFIGVGALPSHRAVSGNKPRACRRNRAAVLCAEDTESISYAASGVDIDLEATSVKSLLTALGTSVRPPGSRGSAVSSPNGFSGLINFTPDTYLAMATDGVGSKLMLASALDWYESVAIDCVAMNVNDLLCIGAEPLAFVDYIATPKPDPDIHAALGRSLAEGCLQARITLCGGETASLPDMVKEYDMAGTALGWLPRGTELDGSKISPENSLIIGIPSSGIHSNGFSLVRKVLESTNVQLLDSPPFNPDCPTRPSKSIWRHNEDESKSLCVGEILLNPTKIYVDPLMDLIMECRDSKSSAPCPSEAIHAMAHITGGGLSNLLRLAPPARKIGFQIDQPLPVLPEFSWMQQASNLTDYEMYRTFNMGMGMALVVDAEFANHVVEWLDGRIAGCRIVGKANASGVVTLPALDVMYDKY